MRIDKEVVEEEIDTEEDLIIVVDKVVFKKKVKCRNIVSEKYKRNITALNITAGDIDAWDISAWDITAGNIDAWNIDAGDITALNIDAWDIDALNITAGNIDAGDISARDIDAGFIICEKRTLKMKENKTFCKNIIIKRSQYEKKEEGFGGN